MSAENLTEYLRVFRAVVEHESFSGAARALNMTPAWVARQVTRLEEHMKASLLIRSTRQLRLTDAGEETYRVAGRVADELQSLRDSLQLKAAEISGVVRLNVPTVFALGRLGYRIADFQTRYPNLTLDIVATDSFVDVFNDEADIVVRIAHTLPDSTAITRKIGDVPRVLCASPEYLALSGYPKTFADLGRHKALVFSALQASTQWHLSDGDEETWIDPVACLRANNSFLLKTAALAGTGLAFLPKVIVEDELRTGALIHLSRFVDCSPFQMYLLRAPANHLPARTRIVWDFLSGGGGAG